MSRGVSTTNPSFPWVMISEVPQKVVVMAGRPLAIASRTTRAEGS